jgi:hypothetical protein
VNKYTYSKGKFFKVAKRKRSKRKPNSMEGLLIKVRAYVLNNKYGVSAEILARKFKVEKHYIAQCFDKLNKEGLLSRAINRASPHREYWNKTYYEIIDKDEPEKF